MLEDDLATATAGDQELSVLVPQAVFLSSSSADALSDSGDRVETFHPHTVVRASSLFPHYSPDPNVVNYGRAVARDMLHKHITRPFRSDLRTNGAPLIECSMCFRCYQQSDPVSVLRACHHHFHFACIWSHVAHLAVGEGINCPICEVPL